MGEVKELKMQISPETPGRIRVLNPFESPSDYSNLHEQTLASPSVFKSAKLPTPGKFRWSIDQLAVINPVEIDPEDIHRQASYLSHSRIDKDVEDKRQKAIEEFFTKDVIVPSPWTDHEGKQLSEYHAKKCPNINSDSPVGRKLTVLSEKSNAACQTLLSLPVDFNLESILGDYFRADELADQSPGNLSSSSLRRKLFLDGNGSVSDSLAPGSPSGSHSAVQTSLEVFYSIDLSPVPCRSPAQTPGSGQFSSSPIQESGKKYSLGSLASPSPISSPTFSPVAFQIGKTPLSEQRKFIFHSPEASSATHSHGISNACIRSPYIEGCSPIKNRSPVRLESCRGGTKYQTSLIQMPFTLEAHSEDEEDKETVPCGDVSSPALGDTGMLHLPQANHCTWADGTNRVTAVSVAQSRFSAAEKELALLRDAYQEKNDTVDMAEPVEPADDNTWVKEPVDSESLPMTDSVTGMTFSIENSEMCMSPLAESSVIPGESSNVQVKHFSTPRALLTPYRSSSKMDSGYNTHTCGSNIMDAVGAESDVQSLDIENKSQAFSIKQEHTTQRCWMKTASPSQCGSP